MRTSPCCRVVRRRLSKPGGQEIYHTSLSLRLCGRCWTLDRPRRFRRLSANDVLQVRCHLKIISFISRLSSGPRSTGLRTFYLSHVSVSKTCCVAGKIFKYTTCLMLSSLKRGTCTRKRVVPNASTLLSSGHRVFVHGLSEKRPSIVIGKPSSTLTDAGAHFNAGCRRRHPRPGAYWLSDLPGHRARSSC